MRTALLVLLGLVAQLCADEFVVPVGGNTSGGGPFGVNSSRYQQVYGSDAFSSLTPVGGGWITGIQFRMVSGFLPPGGDANLQINFSTTSRAVDALSTTFAQNVGGNDTVVLGPGLINFMGGGPGPGGTPGPLGLVPSYLRLTTPFFYNPAAGNLLLDVRTSQGLGNVGFDASSFSTDRTSAVIASDRDSLTGITGTFGLVTGFNITPVVPEPSSVVLLISAAAVFSLFGLRNKPRNNGARLGSVR